MRRPVSRRQLGMMLEGMGRDLQADYVDGDPENQKLDRLLGVIADHLTEWDQRGELAEAQATIDRLLVTGDDMRPTATRMQQVCWDMAKPGDRQGGPT